MKSTEFITEMYDFPEEEMQQYANLIKKDCQPYLQAIGGQVDQYEMYRGMRHVHDAFSKRKVRLDQRYPKDSSHELHDYMNDHFYDTFGAEFRNAVFCTGSLSQVKEYGPEFAVFPIGNFEFLWSPKVEDMFKEWEDFEIEENSDDPRQFIKTRIAGKYTNKNIKKAIDSKHEIMIRCNEYYAVDLSLAWDLHEYIK